MLQRGEPGMRPNTPPDDVFEMPSGDEYDEELEDEGPALTAEELEAQRTEALQAMEQKLGEIDGDLNQMLDAAGDGTDFGKLINALGGYQDVINKSGLVFYSLENPSPGVERANELVSATVLKEFDAMRTAGNLTVMGKNYANAQTLLRSINRQLTSPPEQIKDAVTEATAHFLDATIEVGLASDDMDKFKKLERQVEKILGLNASSIEAYGLADKFEELKQHGLDLEIGQYGFSRSN